MTAGWSTSARSATASRDQHAPYTINAIRDTLSFQLEDYELIGEESLDGLMTTHDQLSEHRREQFVATMKIPVGQSSGDIWVDAEGILGKVLRGVRPDESGDPTKGQASTWTLTAIRCDCPVEPPAE